MIEKANKPWYREPWPWILAAGPLIAVVAGIYTYKLAVSSSDGLVADDYYKQGLAAGKTIAQSDRAEFLGLTAHVLVTADSLTVRLTAKAELPKSASLHAMLSHPTRAGMDQSLDLLPEGDHYVAKLRMPDSGHWLLLIEDAEKSWRLLGNVVLPATQEVTIGQAATEARAPADK